MLHDNMNVYKLRAQCPCLWLNTQYDSCYKITILSHFFNDLSNESECRDFKRKKNRCKNMNPAKFKRLHSVVK